MKRCKFIYKDGKKCYSTYVIEDGFCFNHSPSKGEKLKAIKKEKQALAKEFKLPSPNPMKQIRLNCMDCCGDRVKAVKFCASVNCKLWYLRFGCLPKAYVRNEGKEAAKLFNKENFARGKCYDPRMLVEEMEV